MKPETWLALAVVLLAAACMPAAAPAPPRADLHPRTVVPNGYLAVVVYGSPRFDATSLRSGTGITLASDAGSIPYHERVFREMSEAEWSRVMRAVVASITDTIPGLRPLPPPPPVVDVVRTDTIGPRPPLPPPPAERVVFWDINGDGHRDAVLLFRSGEVLPLIPRGTGRWLTLNVAGNRGFSTVAGSGAVSADTDTIWVGPRPLPLPPPPR